MEYVRVINQAELPANSMTVVTVGDKQVLLANVDGAIHAIANKCTHLGASLGKGVLQGGIVACPSTAPALTSRPGRRSATPRSRSSRCTSRTSSAIACASRGMTSSWGFLNRARPSIRGTNRKEQPRIMIRGCSRARRGVSLAAPGGDRPCGSARRGQRCSAR